MKTILITGAEGFAGSHLLENLRQRGADVVAGVRNRGRKLAMERRNGRAIVCDVSDAINVARAVASVKPDGIIHLAAASSVHAADEEPLEAYQSIVSGWANVLDGVRRVVPRSRVLLISACDVYGNSGADGRAMNEDTPVAPVTTFGSMKANAEAIARTFFKNYHLNVTIARPFHHTGFGQSDRFFFAAAARRVAALGDNGELRLPDLGVRRDLLHVRDVVDAYAVLLADGKPNETYNVCSGEARTCGDWIRALIGFSGRNVTLSEADGDATPQRVACFKGDNSKLRALGWKPNCRVEDALADLIRGFQAAPANVPEPAYA